MGGEPAVLAVVPIMSINGAKMQIIYNLLLYFYKKSKSP